MNSGWPKDHRGAMVVAELGTGDSFCLGKTSASCGLEQ
jgi:hypothetical protein